jgi:hypothetical protein
MITSLIATERCKFSSSMIFTISSTNEANKTAPLISYCSCESAQSHTMLPLDIVD